MRLSKLTFLLTTECNLRCQMCGVWRRKRAGKLDPDGVETGDLIRALDEMLAHSPTIEITGGEPLLSPHWFPLAAHAAGLGLTVNLITNGWHLAAEAGRVASSGLRTLRVSVDGPRDVHDAIRGVPGAFDRAMAGLAVLAALPTRPRIEVLCTISDANVGRLVELAEHLRGLPVDLFMPIHLNFRSPWHYEAHAEAFEKTFGHSCDGRDAFTYDPGALDVGTIRQELAELAGRPWPFVVATLPKLLVDELDRYYLDPRYCRPTTSDCGNVWSALAVAPSGDVGACLGETFGNIRRERLETIWASPALQDFRERFRTHGRLPVCGRCCMG